MSKYEKPKFTEEELGYNPFLNKLEVLVNEVRSKDMYKSYGLSEDQIWDLANYEYEAVPYCRVYSDAERRKAINQLPPRAKDLLMWVFYETNPGKCYLWLNKERYMEENGVSAFNTYKVALVELLRRGFIQKTVVTDVYWINPHYFFNGSRIKAFPDNLIKRRIK